MFIKRTKPLLITMLALLSTVLFIQGISAQNAASSCPLGQGYWKNTATWPVTQLSIGSQTYSQAELLIILNTPVEGDASLNLARQLIAAKLNLAAGADSAVINSVIMQTEALLSGFNGKLPYTVAPSSEVGQTMVSLAGVLDVYNSGQLAINCAVTLTPSPTPLATLTSTPEATPEATPDLDDDDLPITIVIEGPVQAINVNIITIYNINIQVRPDDPILTVVQIGDVIRVEGNTQVQNNVIIVIAVTVVIVDPDIVVINPGVIWRDDGNCNNPPPDWAPANGWRRRCQPSSYDDDDKGKKKKNKDDDDDDDD